MLTPNPEFLSIRPTPFTASYDGEDDQMLGNAPNEKLGQVPDEKLDEGADFSQCSLHPRKGCRIVRFPAEEAACAARGQVLDYGAMATGRGEAEGYLTVWGNESVVGRIWRFEEELDDRERASACSEH